MSSGRVGLAGADWTDLCLAARACRSREVEVLVRVGWAARTMQRLGLTPEIEMLEQTPHLFFSVVQHRDELPQPVGVPTRVGAMPSPRWAMSYLRGPMTREQIRKARGEREAA